MLEVSNELSAGEVLQSIISITDFHLVGGGGGSRTYKKRQQYENGMSGCTG